MRSTTFTLEDLKPNTPDGKIIWVERNVLPEIITDDAQHYFNICEHVVSGPGWFMPRYPHGYPNPCNMAVWYDNVPFGETPHDSTEKTFEEITDERAAKLLNLFSTKPDLPIVISYSGGIDSAVIVAAAIRNWPRDILDRVIIKMNNASFFESPKMYYDVIVKNNLRIQDKVAYDWENSFYIAGEPGDAVWITTSLTEMALVYDNPHKMSVYKDAKKLLGWLSHLTGIESAHWFYNLNIENAAHYGFEIETFEDFFWWAKTNLAMGANRLKLIDHIANPWIEGSFDRYLTRGLPWYHTLDYRKWSNTHRNTGVKFDGTLTSYKMPAKQYINSVLKDPYYERYKIKVNSAYNKAKNVLALFNDGTLILDETTRYWHRQNV